MTLLTFTSNIPNITINASAQYSIDNGTLFTFPVAAPVNLDQAYNLVSFQTGLLSPGPHHLFVEYGVDNFVEGSAPLILDYFIIQNQTLPSVPPNTTSPQSPTTTPIVQPPGLSQGAIAGVVIGSLVGLALIVFGLIRFIKGKKAAASLVREYKPDAAYYGEGPGLEGEKMTFATFNRITLQCHCISNRTARRFRSLIFKLWFMYSEPWFFFWRG